jgi:hypothetical protein
VTPAMKRSASLIALSMERQGEEWTSLWVVRVTTKLRTPRAGLRGYAAYKFHLNRMSLLLALMDFMTARPATATTVAAAASVPSSLTSPQALWKTPEM